MTGELITIAIGAVGGILTTWVKMNTEITKIKGRLISLEKQETKVIDTLNALVEGMNEIKLLLAKKGIE
jgi:hypothetical protein